MGPTSVLISATEAKFALGGDARCSSEDIRTRREFGVAWRFGRRVRRRWNWERWLTWKWHSRPSVVSQYLPTPRPALHTNYERSLATKTGISESLKTHCIEPLLAVSKLLRYLIRLLKIREIAMYPMDTTCISILFQLFHGFFRMLFLV